jgi:protoporphyrinogen oxidase
MFDEKIWKRDDPRVQSERVEFALTNNSKSKDDKNEEANNVVMRALRAQVDV